MSDSDKTIICPNCGFHTVGNYCSECGQKTHLHKETFWGLVMHFVGDYFHYDSKFWLTIKALWFSPGKLTIAYWNRQRMRYIPPVSLYIFISAVYFLLSFNSKNDWVKIDDNSKKTTTRRSSSQISIKNTPNSQLDNFINGKFEKINKEYGDASGFIMEKVNHNLSKLFFFMIPVMAMLLKLLFMRRKDLFFVDHAIFSLHYHSFWFSLFMLDLFNYPMNIKLFITFIFQLIAAYYLIVAMHNSYKINWSRAIFTGFTLAFGYILALAIIFLAYLSLIVVFA